MKSRGNKVHMVDQVDRQELVRRLQYGGPTCEFFKYPEGIVKQGAFVKSNSVRTKRPDSLKGV